MKIEQIYTGCLSQGAYYIESDNEAVIIDPLREVNPYIQKAKRRNAKIKYVLETHFHADFVSGHKDLAAKTGATIVFGPTNVHLGFDAVIAKDGQEFKVGGATIKVIHTPGHTMESTCYLLIDEEGKEKALFTGDTLFIGDVGRPDLAQKVDESLTQEKLAGHLYDSLRNKIMPLSDDLVVYPAHGAGSACGKNMSKETSDTLGNQKKTNYALQEMDKSTFIKKVTEGLTPPPSYFPQNVKLNIQGYESIDEVLHRGEHPLKPEEFEALANQTGAVLLDTRAPQEFAKGFIPNSINIGIDGNFAVWVGTLIPDVNKEILVIAEEGREEEVITRLARVGYDHALGYLEGGFETWKKTGKEIDSITSISVDELANRKESDPDIQVLDVRKGSEYDSEHVVGAINSPLDYINEHMDNIEKDKTYYVHCASGYRSMIFSSIMKARGYDRIIDIDGGFKGIKSSGKFELTDYTCPSSQL
ncbi:MBL fold metallo-hydrolase [Echinicola jeungdonensis]|uniref:Rhodanese-like domain-containing protein n=1 Tax=Echinicola jeungdonensis TaxID=709343 RepID=A0ABV5J476_9BACT|nr:MBL fold metallo-hydrolase [Echinicola jeungdonensis]MDN3670056.1 MBL fold metallo-hydrolase [Echinicola jeungdonensis]